MVTTYDIGLAHEGEATAVALLSREIVEYGFRWSWTPERVRASIANRSTNVLVARDGGVVIGFALMEYGDKAAHLVLLGVAPGHRRRGIAGALLAWLERTLRVAGIARIEVEVRETNHPARAFYRVLGYVEADRVFGYYQGRENAVKLYKLLGASSP